MTKYKLNIDTIIADKLSYHQAKILCKKFDEQLGNIFLFSIQLIPNEHGWKVLARSKAATQSFIDEPEKFYVEI